MTNNTKKNNDYVVVIGGATIDILGIPFNSLSLHDSAPGKIQYTSGGVGRNIAENLARLGVDVKFISAFGDDANGERLKRELTNLGVDLSLSLTVAGEITSAYVCLNDKCGDMQYALADMRILERMDESFFADKLDVINNAKCVVLDTNLGDTLGYLLSKITVPVFLDTVSTQKTERCKKYLKNLFFVKPNVVEAETLVGMKIQSDADVERAAERILALGNSNVVISLGEKGAYFANESERVFLPNEHCQVVSTTGAGDSFMAATIYGYVNDLPLCECAALGLKAACITVASVQTVSKNIEKLKINRG